MEFSFVQLFVTIELTLFFSCSFLRKLESLRKNLDRLRRRRMRLSAVRTLRRYISILEEVAVVYWLVLSSSRSDAVKIYLYVEVIKKK